MTIFSRKTTEEDRSGTVAHSHSSTGYLHMHHEYTAPTALSILLIDLSDTSTWPHVSDSYWHLDILQMRIDAENNALWVISLWLLEDLTSTDCTKTMVWKNSGSKAIGNSIDITERLFPYGPVGDSSKLLSSMRVENSSDYNLSTLLRSLASIDTPAAYPGNGDLVVDISVSDADIDLQMNIGYHTHDQFHD